MDSKSNKTVDVASITTEQLALALHNHHTTVRNIEQQIIIIVTELQKRDSTPHVVAASE
jgi:hypothetical protein